MSRASRSSCFLPALLSRASRSSCLPLLLSWAASRGGREVLESLCCFSSVSPPLHFIVIFVLHRKVEVLRAGCLTTPEKLYLLLAPVLCHLFDAIALTVAA